MAYLDSLVSYWALDEASGNRADSHGSNTLTDNNTVGSATGKINTAADVERSASEYLSCASNSELQTGDIDFTLAAWVNLESSQDMIIIGKDTDSPANSRDYTLDYAEISPGVFRFRFYINGGAGGAIAVSSLALSTSTWYYVLGWHDAAGNTVNVQVNNGSPNSAATGGASPNVSSAEFRVGARQYSGFQGYWDGLIDEAALWKRLLTSDERTSLYNSGSGFAYPFGEGGGGAVLRPSQRLTLMGVM